MARQTLGVHVGMICVWLHGRSAVRLGKGDLRCPVELSGAVRRKVSGALDLQEK